MRIRILVPIALAGLGFSLAAHGQPLDRAAYEAARKTLESDFRTARTGCEPMLGNVRVVCMAELRGREAVALAELRVRYDPTDEARMEVRVLKARSELAVARARCEDVAVHRKAACKSEAEEAHAAVLAAPLRPLAR